MAKALMVACSAVTLASGDEYNLFGLISDATTEAPTQASCTENAAFTALGVNIISGGSGTNTVTFRDAGADGQNVASRSGAGVAEDTTHTDTLTAGDLFNLAYTDTGTSSTTAWTKANVELASGYGAFQGSAAYAGSVMDAASATNFIPLTGNLPPDGTTPEANVAFKARGYDTFEALQVRVTANARTNDSVFKNRINAADGTGVITFAAGVTGLVTATGLGDAITAGQTIGASVTLLTGVEDLTVTFVTATLKSSITKQDIWAGVSSGTARAASATAHYSPIGGLAFASVLTSFTEAQARVKPGFAGTASNLRCYLSANTYGADATLKLYKAGSAVITTTLTASGGAGWYENTSDTVSFTDTDELSFEFVGGTSGSATIRMVGVTLAPTTGTTAETALDSDGAAVATAAGAAQAAAVLSSAGSSTATLVGYEIYADGYRITEAGDRRVTESTAEQRITQNYVVIRETALSAAGAGTATAVGASTVSIALSSSGASTATAGGQSTVSVALSSVGASVATAAGQSISAAALSSTGASTATAVGVAVVSGALSSTGVSTATATTQSTASTAVSSQGAATGTLTTTSTVASTLSSVASATATAQGAATVSAVLSATGVSIATAAGASTAQSVLNATGSSTATLEGTTIADGSADMSAVGASTADAATASIAAGAMSAVGTATAEAVTETIAAAAMSATGSSTAILVGTSTTADVDDIVRLGARRRAHHKQRRRERDERDVAAILEMMGPQIQALLGERP